MSQQVFGLNILGFFAEFLSKTCWVTWYFFGLDKAFLFFIFYYFVIFEEAKRSLEKDGLAHEMTPLKSEGLVYFCFYYFGIFYGSISVLCSVLVVHISLFVHLHSSRYVEKRNYYLLTLWSSSIFYFPSSLLLFLILLILSN